MRVPLAPTGQIQTHTYTSKPTPTSLIERNRLPVSPHLVILPNLIAVVASTDSLQYKT